MLGYLKSCETMAERAAKRAKTIPLNIQVQKFENGFKFVGVYFDLTIFLQDDEGQLQTGG